MERDWKKELAEISGINRNLQIRSILEELAETAYGEFSAGLIPGEVRLLGVRIPKLRQIAKVLAKGDWREYLKTASDESMEEILLQGMTIGYVKTSLEERLSYLDIFVPKIRNWSVCDSTCASLKVAREEPDIVWEYLQKYLGSAEEFEIRFGVVMLLDYYISKEYLDRIYAWMERICHPGYYVKMAVAWNISVCYAKFPEETDEYLKRCRLDDWTYNKAIQKIIESNRVSKEEKERLRLQKR